MAHINLLPWREEARREKQKLFLTLLVATCILSFLTVFGISLIYGEMVAGQLKRNAYIESELKVLDARIAEIKVLTETKKSLQQRMSLIEQLQSSRNLGTQVFTEVAKTVPAGIYLAELEKKSEAVLVVGRSESNNRLSNMIRQVEGSELLEFVNLQSITAGQESRLLSDFTLQLKVDRFSELEKTAEDKP